MDLNSCTPVELEALRGIGPFYAEQLIDYRDRLGGFTSTAQFTEVPKVPDSVFSKLDGLLEVDLGQVRKIRINTVTAERLGAHPYLTRRQANTIVSYRDNHGPFRTSADLLATVVVTPKLERALAPYLNFTLDGPSAE